MTDEQLSFNLGGDEPGPISLEAGAWLLPRFALTHESELLTALASVVAAAPLRNMVTPGGFRMSVAMTNCGKLGWVSDERGYRYSAVDPLSGDDWPAMPAAFERVARDAASASGFPEFAPDACLVNRYEPGARLTLHQDKNERDFDAPIVSVSLGLPAIFLFGGMSRSTRARRVQLVHGDIVVWGGPARLNFHGVLPVKSGQHALLGAVRFNLTFRKAQ